MPHDSVCPEELLSACGFGADLEMLGRATLRLCGYARLDRPRFVLRFRQL